MQKNCSCSKESTEYYVLEVIGNIEPTLHGPFLKREDRDNEALRLRRNDPDRENGLYMLDNINGKPQVSAYSGGFMEQAFEGKHE